MRKLILESSLNMIPLPQAVLNEWYEFKESILPVIRIRIPGLVLEANDYVRVFADGSVDIFCPHQTGEISKSFPPKTFFID